MLSSGLPENRDIKICIAGPGAIGTTLAALLGQKNDVSVIARGDSLETIGRSGVHLLTADRRVVADVHVSDGSDMPVQDVVLLCGKAQDLPSLAAQSSRAIGPQTMVLPVVNGIPWWYFHGEDGPLAGRTVHSVDPDGALQSLLPPAQIVGAIAVFTAERLGPGVAQALNPVKMVIGEIDNVVRPRSRSFAETMSRCGIETRTSERIRDPLWTKVIANLMSNPLSVVAEAPLKDVCGSEALSSITRRLMSEALLTAAAFGARCELTPDQLIALGANMGDAKTSMLQDFQSGRPLELGAICESVMELAALRGIEMPLTRQIAALARYRSASHRAAA